MTLCALCGAYGIQNQAKRSALRPQGLKPIARIRIQPNYAKEVRGLRGN